MSNTENIQQFLLRKNKDKDLFNNIKKEHTIETKEYGCYIDFVANSNGSETDFEMHTYLFYEKHKKEIWKIINKKGGLLEVLANDSDEQYIEDDETFKLVLSWLAVELVAKKLQKKKAGII